MGSKRTRASRNKQAVESPVNGRAADDIDNADASERETEPDIDATGADGAETCTETQKGRKIYCQSQRSFFRCGYLVEFNLLNARRCSHFKKLSKLNHDKYAPSLEDWENDVVLCKCLEMFYEDTKLHSGTANLFFS